MQTTRHWLARPSSPRFAGTLHDKLDMLGGSTRAGATRTGFPHSGGTPTAMSGDAQCMAAAADRLAGDGLERVSPELVLVDAALAEQVRRLIHAPWLSVHVAEVGVERDPVEEMDALPGDEIPPVPPAAFEEEHGYLGIDDLIVIPEDDLRSMAATLVAVPNEDITQRAPEPGETLPVVDSDADDLIVVPADGRAHLQSASRSFPPLPSPSSDADGETATDVALRLIRDQLQHEKPRKRRRRWFLRFGS
jgi:hypothetical protein